MPQNLIGSNHINAASQEVVSNSVNNSHSNSMPRAVKYGISASSSGDAKVVPGIPSVGGLRIKCSDVGFSTNKSETFAQGKKQ